MLETVSGSLTSSRSARKWLDCSPCILVLKCITTFYMMNIILNIENIIGHIKSLQLEMSYIISIEL